MDQNKTDIEIVASLPGLNKESKENIIMQKLKMQEEEMKSGILDRFFGHINTKFYIALILVILLIILGLIINVTNKTPEYWNLIFPLIGTFVGYIFGKGIKE